MIVIWNDPNDLVYNSWEEQPIVSGNISQMNYDEGEKNKNPIGFIWEKDKTDEIN